MKKLFHSTMAMLLVLTMLSTSVLAAAVDYVGEADDYYKVISKKDWELAPGITESEIVLNNDSGDRRQVMHVVEVDMDNEYTKVIPSTKGMVPTAGSYGVQTMDLQAAYAEANGYGNVVAAMNISLSWYDSTYYDQHPELVGEPLGYLILDGVQYTNSQGKTSGAQTCLVINFDEKDGIARPSDIPKTQIRSTADDITGWEEQVIPANFGFLVKDGKMVNTNEEHTSEGASRSMLGIKEDGSIIMVMNDGRQAPYSTGFNNYEMSEAMLKLGCVYAINGDGGGSSQFLSQRPGEELKVNCSPSDGALRATTHGVLVISTAPSTGEFVRAHVETDNEYYTPGSSVQFNAIGADLAGGAADIPSDAYWKLSDSDMGTIDETGLFVSNGTTGEVTAQLMYNDEVKGSATINIVVPDAISFGGAAAYTVPFDETITLSVTATYGLFDVVLKPEDYTISIEDSTLGTLIGNQYTSGQTAGTTNITVTLNGANISNTIPLTVGKGSDVIFSFEDGTEGANLDNWVIKDHEGKYEPYSDISIVTSENGMVHNGEKALAVHMPNHEHVDGGEGYYANSITWVGDRILLENATAIGMWVYIPEEATQTEIALNYVWYNDQGVQQRTTPDLCLNDSFNGIESSGWYYLSVPISTNVAYIEDATQVAASQGYKRNFFLKFYVTNSGNAGDESSYFGDITYYIDDVTVDYSDAVEDRVNPTFEATYAKNISADNDVVLSASDIKEFNDGAFSFTAEVSDNVAIDAEEAHVFVDGKEIDATYKNGRITSEDITLETGVHRIVYEIADTMGNVSKAVRYISIFGTDIAVNVIPQNPDATVALTGSVYWLDVVANNAEDIDTITMKLDLDTMHTWELANAELAYNYDIEYYYSSVADKDENLITIVLTNNGSDVSGKAVIASLPIRVWSYCGNAVSSDINAAEAWTEGFVPAVSVNVDVEYGEVLYKQNTNTIFSAEKIHVDTEAYIHQYKMDKTYFATNTYHVHTEEAIDDEDETCTKNGYIGRTFCEECKSVVEWGTTTPATGHNYTDIDGKRQCEVCKDLFTGTFEGKEYVDGELIGSEAGGWVGNSYYVNGAKLTGIKKVPAVDGSGEYYYDFGDDGISKGFYTGLISNEDDSLSYTILGKLASGWQYIDGNNYYFSTKTLKAVDGEYSVNGKKHTFENYILVDGCWETDEEGTKLYWMNSYVWRKLIEVRGKTYYFDTDYHMATGVAFTVISAQNYKYYAYDENGVWMKDFTGLYEVDGFNYYIVDGVSVYGKEYPGLVQIGDDYYYVRSNGQLATGKYTITKTRGLLPTGTYTFDEDGKMLNPPTIEPDPEEPPTEEPSTEEPEIKNGIVNESGTLYYYVDGVRTYAGLIEIDGDYYYVRTSGELAIGRYWITKSNGLLPAITYNFGKDGKMLNPPTIEPDPEEPPTEEPEIKNGIVNESGTLYYYVDGVRTYAGLIEIDGDYYYVRTSGELAIGRYWITKSNGLLPAITYNFGKDGKMLNPPIM